VKNKILWPVALILVFALSRLLVFASTLLPGDLADMPANFSAAYALLFCAGLYLPRRLAWSVPLGVMLGTDLILTFGHYHPSGGYSLGQFARDQAPNYLAYALLVGLGVVLGRKRSWITLLGGGILGALLFYLVTNTASWISLGYPRTLAGWIQALTVGKPGYPTTWEFFRSTLLSGGIFSALFVGAMKWVEATEPAPAREEAEAEEEEPAPLVPAAEDTGES
jgi:hypothetical protein